MSLPNSFPVYGYTYNSFTNENEGEVELTFTFADGTEVDIISDSNGFYELDIQDYANNGEQISIYGTNGYYQGTETYLLNVSDLSHKETVYLDEEISDLKIHYGDLADEYISCWCSEWSERTNGFVVTTVINKTKCDFLRDNTRPGAVDTKKIVGYGYMNFDATWDGSNTLTFKPNKKAVYSWLSNKKDNITGYVRNLSIAPFGEGTDLFTVQIECVKANNTL